MQSRRHTAERGNTKECAFERPNEALPENLVSNRPGGEAQRNPTTNLQTCVLMLRGCDGFCGHTPLASQIVALFFPLFSFVSSCLISGLSSTAFRTLFLRKSTSPATSWGPILWARNVPVPTSTEKASPAESSSPSFVKTVIEIGPTGCSALWLSLPAPPSLAAVPMNSSRTSRRWRPVIFETPERERFRAA